MGRLEMYNYIGIFRLETLVEHMSVVPSRFRSVTIDGIWIGYWIYGPLVYTTGNRPLTHTD
jgi:hypothetical protein